MSQNKTVVPGMESGGNFGNEQPTDFYSRGNNGGYSAKGTIVPGMESVNKPKAHTSTPFEESIHTHTKPGKPVFGFLYSISRQGIGEYWPLYLGQNTIGSSPKCDICLQEGTVSGEHAVLVVRKMKNPEKTIASISDTRSTNGTMINGESLGFSAMECFNGDIITIGENYELVILLIDVKALGLKVAPNFIPINNPGEFPNNEADPYSPGGNTQPGYDDTDFPPKFTGTTGNYNPYNSDGTVGMDGSGSIKPGGTVGM